MLPVVEKVCCYCVALMSRLMCAMEQYLAKPQLELRVLAMCLAEIVADELRPDQTSRAHTANAQQSFSESVWPTSRVSGI